MIDEKMAGGDFAFLRDEIADDAADLRYLAMGPEALVRCGGAEQEHDQQGRDDGEFDGGDAVFALAKADERAIARYAEEVVHDVGLHPAFSPKGSFLKAVLLPRTMTPSPPPRLSLSRGNRTSHL